MRHKPVRERGHWDDHATLAHEMTHGIHFDLRLTASAYRPMNGFYVFDGLGVVVAEPRFTKSAVAARIPQIMRSTRFHNYLTAQTSWDARPLYVWDEWTAYVNGAAVAIERYQLGMQTFERGRDLPPFRWPKTEPLLVALRASPEAEPLRQSIRGVYGAPWAQRVLGF
jgi:hypothetical protein